MVVPLLALCVAATLWPGALTEETCRSKEECDSFEEELIQTFRKGCPVGYSDVKCALKKRKEINEWLAKNNQFNILIVGKMGTGKTTLVKGLKGLFNPEKDHLEPHTKKVTLYDYEHNEVEFTFFDTPGLKDNVKGSNDYSYLKEMVDKNEHPDLVVFALKMDDLHFREEDIGAIGNITEAFGWKVWKNAMFILTFANKVSKPGTTLSSRENKIYYSELRNKFALQVTKELRKRRVQEEVANNIPVIPVGVVTEPFIKSDDRGISWVDEFWESMFKILKPKPAPRSKKQAKSDFPKEKKSQNKSYSWWWWWCFWPLC